MYKLFITIIFVVFQTIVIAQDQPTKNSDSPITGDWHGQLDVMGTKLRISFHILTLKYNTAMIKQHTQFFYV